MRAAASKGGAPSLTKVILYLEPSSAQVPFLAGTSAEVLALSAGFSGGGVAAVS